MKPNQALKHLSFITDNQKTVSTNKLKELVKVIASHQRMLEKDNRRLRNRIRRQRRVINEYDNLPKRAEVTE